MFNKNIGLNVLQKAGPWLDSERNKYLAKLIYYYLNLELTSLPSALELKNLQVKHNISIKMELVKGAKPPGILEQAQILFDTVLVGTYSASFSSETLKFDFTFTNPQRRKS